MPKTLAPMLAAMVALAVTLPLRAETLVDAMIMAYQTNPDLQAQRTALKATDEGVNRATAGFLPRVTGSGQITSARIDNNLSPQAFTTPQRFYQARVDQSLFRGFQDFNSRRQAKSLVEAGRAQLRSTEQTIFLKAVTAYMDVLRDEAVLRLTQNNVEVLTRQLQATQDRFRVGEITRTDVAQAEARLAGAVSTRISAEAGLAASRATYRQIIGQQSGNLEQPPAPPPLPTSLEEAIEIALAMSPGIATAKHNEEAAKHAVEQAKGGLLPTVDGFVSIARSETTFLQIGQTFDNISVVKTIGAQVSIPLYQGGGEYSDIRRAKQIRSQRRLEIVAADRLVQSQVRTTWELYRAAQSSIKSNQSLVRANEIALDGVRQEAAVGSRTTLDVLDAEQELLDARVQLVRAERDEYVAAFELLASVGELNVAKLNLSVEAYDPESHYRKVKHKLIGWGTSDG